MTDKPPLNSLDVWPWGLLIAIVVFAVAYKGGGLWVAVGATGLELWATARIAESLG